MLAQRTSRVARCRTASYFCLMVAASAVVSCATSGEDTAAGAFFDVVEPVGVGSVAFDYEDIATMQAEVDLVVRGRITEVRDGRPPMVDREGQPVAEPGSEARSSMLDLAVDEVLAGDGQRVIDGRISNLEVVALAGVEEAALPSEPAVFFLVAQDAAARRSGLGPAWEAAGRGYWVLPHPDALLVERDGTVVSAFDHGHDHGDERGDEGHRITTARSLDELESEVRAAEAARPSADS